jgi:hypothetical protein
LDLHAGTAFAHPGLVSLEADDLATFVEDDVSDDTPTGEIETGADADTVEEDSGRVIALYPDTALTITPAPDLMDDLRLDNERLAGELARAEEQLTELRTKIVSMEYGQRIADQHIAYLEREREGVTAARARLEQLVDERNRELEQARAREIELRHELEGERADNLATVELLEIEHRQALASERRMHEKELATAKRHATQRLAEADDARTADIAMLEAEHARALADLEADYESRIAAADLRAAQSLAVQYLILVANLQR